MPTPNLAKIAAASDVLGEQIAALEAAHPQFARAALNTPAPGWKIVGTVREHVHDDPAIIRAAFARWLFWRHYLRHIHPTDASLVRAARRIRGWLVYLLALRREAQGQPLPLRDAHQRVPHYALARWPAPAHVRRVTEVQLTRMGTDDLGDNQSNQQDHQDDSDNPGDWWATYGAGDALADLTADEFDAIKAAFGAPYIEDVGSLLTFDDVLSLASARGLSELQLLQLLDAAWARSTAADAGARTFEDMGLDTGLDTGLDMGITGAFDLSDPYFLDFLRQQSGYLITNIDETTRQFVAQTLYTFLGGDDGLFQPQGVPDLARLLQQFGNAFPNDLAGMSRYRAYLIAATETARAESFGSFVAMWQTGVRHKQWMVTTGACLLCIGNAEAGAIPLLADFPSGHKAPPLHPLCRCAAVAVIPDTFNPDDWQSRDPGVFSDALFQGDFASWPNTDLSALEDVELPDVDLAAQAEVTRVRSTHKHHHPLSASVATIEREAKRDAQVGQLLADAADAAAVAWARAAGVRVPVHLDQWRALKKRTDAGQFSSADTAYAKALHHGLAAALARWQRQKE